MKKDDEKKDDKQMDDKKGAMLRRLDESHSPHIFATVSSVRRAPATAPRRDD